MSWLLETVTNAVFTLLNLYFQWKEETTPRRYDDAHTVERKALTRGLGLSIAVTGIAAVLAVFLTTLFSDANAAGVYAGLIAPLQQALILGIAAVLSLSLVCLAYFSFSLWRLER